MVWSTRELADLAGTTLRTVRHYHDVGLLPEPERTANGYKQYGVAHLTRVLRIRRLVDLGMPLDDILAMDESLEPDPDELQAIDAEIRARIDQLSRLREELEVRAAQAVPSELPLELGFTAHDESFPEIDRQLFVVLSRVLRPEQLVALAASARDPRSAADAEFYALAPDADDATIQAVAEAMLPHSIATREKHPDVPDLFSPELRRNRMLHEALAEIFNPAQLEVYRRISALRTSR